MPMVCLWYGYGTAMVWLWHTYAMITQMLLGGPLLLVNPHIQFVSTPFFIVRMVRLWNTYGVDMVHLLCA